MMVSDLQEIIEYLGNVAEEKWRRLENTFSGESSSR